MLKSAGFEKTESNSADVLFIVACAVRQTAVDRIFGKIRNWKGGHIILTNCVIEKDKKRLADKGALYWDYDDPKQLAQILSLDAEETARLLEEGRKMSLYVPIMTGCNNFCSYCAVPYTRGREASRPMPDILNDIKNILNQSSFTQGSEIMLLGQNVNSFKLSDKFHVKDKKDFTVLLEEINKLQGNFIVSFTSNHPKDITEDIIKAVSSLPKIKKEIHLPIQSGSDKILKAMNRPYTKQRFLEIVETIKKIDPKIQITTDVIVGFPGETEEDFEETVDVFKKVKFAKAFVNKYSPRVGTAAYKLGDPISWEQKQRRWRELDKLANRG